MEDFLHKFKPTAKTDELNSENHLLPEKQMILTGATLEIFRDIRQRLENLDYRLAALEKKLEERIPGKVLTEQKFIQETEMSDDMVDKIISEVRSATKPLIASRQQLTIVEHKKIEKIISILQQHEKLSSIQLSQMLNLSRTRCNEYFKQMEELGLVEGIDIGKERYYKLKD
jgi:response regulator of citrate/malate metabolism